MEDDFFTKLMNEDEDDPFWEEEPDDADSDDSDTDDEEA